MKYSNLNLLVFFIIIASWTSCQYNSATSYVFGLESTTKYKIGDDVSYLVIGSDATEERLQEIAAKFKAEQDIDISTEGTQYDDDGYAVNLKLKVSTKNGRGGLSSSESNVPAGFVVEKNSFRIGSNLSSEYFN